MDELTACSTSMALEPLAKGLIDATQDRRAMSDKLVAFFTRLSRNSVHRSCPPATSTISNQQMPSSPKSS